jgi:hypothetical protein
MGSDVLMRAFSHLILCIGLLPASTTTTPTTLPPEAKLAGLNVTVAPVLANGIGLVFLTVSESSIPRSFGKGAEVTLEYQDGTTKSVKARLTVANKDNPNGPITWPRSFKGQTQAFRFYVDAGPAVKFKVSWPYGVGEGVVASNDLFPRSRTSVSLCVDGAMEELVSRKGAYTWNKTLLPCAQLTSGIYRNGTASYYLASR